MTNIGIPGQNATKIQDGIGIAFIFLGLVIWVGAGFYLGHSLRWW